MEPIIDKKIGFIGGGNMCYAICCGMIKKGVISPSNIIVSGPTPANLEKFSTMGINVTSDNKQVALQVNILVLSVKPNMLSMIADELDGIKKQIKVQFVISILAGIKLATLEQCFRNPELLFVRVMPNTPLLVGAGVTAYVINFPDKNEHCENVLKAIFECSGICVKVPEKNMDAIVGVSGSGPAYGFLMIEALADGGVKAGLPRALAQTLAAHTLLGASKMVLETGKHPGELKDMVCSPAGTTIAAVHSLERNGIRSALIEAVEAATNRSIELGLINK